MCCDTAYMLKSADLYTVGIQNLVEHRNQRSDKLLLKANVNNNITSESLLKPKNVLTERPLRENYLNK